MKKTLLFIFMNAVLLQASAQLKKGDFLFGGSVKFARQSSNLGSTPTTSTSLSVAPHAGYFVINKLAAGLRAQYTWNKFRYMEAATITDRVIAPFARYYILKADQRVNLFGEASVFVSRQKSSAGGSSNINKMRGYSFAAGPVFFITRQVALELSAEFTDTYNVATRRFDNSAIGSKVGIQVHL